jgi:hypothetical protein
MTAASDPPGPARGPERVSTRIGRQQAEQINTAGRDQVVDQRYQQYVHQVTERRDSLLRDIASTRTRAWGLVVVGFVLFFLGFGAFAYGVLGFMAQGAESMSTNTFPTGDELTPFGPPVLGVPLGLLGWAVAALGSFLMIVGLVLHVVASARRRRVDRETPVPPPVPPPSWWGTAAGPDGRTGR